MPITRKQAIRDLDLKVGGSYCPNFLDDAYSVSPKGLINCPRLTWSSIWHLNLLGNKDLTYLKKKNQPSRNSRRTVADFNEGRGARRYEGSFCRWLGGRGPPNTLSSGASPPHTVINPSPCIRESNCLECQWVVIRKSCHFV